MRTKEEKKPVKKKEKDKAPRNWLALWKTAYYDENKRVFVNRDGTCYDLLRIRPKDLSNANEDEIQTDIMKFQRMYRTVSDDLKLVCLSYPCKVQKQVEYFERLKARNDSANYLYWIDTKLEELEYLRKNSYSREYVLMVYANSTEELEKNKLGIMSSMGQTRDLIEEMDGEMKIDILARLNNKSSAF